MSKTTKVTKSVKSVKEDTNSVKDINNVDQIPDKLINLFKELGIPVTIDRYTKSKFITLTNQIKELIPFDVMSDKFKIAESKKSTQTNKINVIEMVYTMKSKPKITTTTKPNIYKCIPFFEAVGKLKINQDTFEVYNDKGLFRAEEKFTFRLTENLKRIFPGIENKILSQESICTIRRAFVIDVCIKISDSSVIGIEFDESHHFERDKEVSDNLKRNLMSKLLELRIFKAGIDDFDHFLRALCYDIIKCHDAPETRDMKIDYICSFIAYNISKRDNVEIDTDGIKHYVSLLGDDTNDTIDINVLSNMLLNSYDDSESIDLIIKKYLKSGLIKKTKIIFDDDENIISLYKSEVLKFVMMFNDSICDDSRTMFARIIPEYILLLSGKYDKYRYTCPFEQFIMAMEDEVLAYSMTPPPKTIRKIKQGNTINTVKINNTIINNKYGNNNVTGTKNKPKQLTRKNSKNIKSTKSTKSINSVKSTKQSEKPSGTSKKHKSAKSTKSDDEDSIDTSSNVSNGNSDDNSNTDIESNDVTEEEISDI